jgi:hypothetical protein
MAGRRRISQGGATPEILRGIYPAATRCELVDTSRRQVLSKDSE